MAKKTVYNTKGKNKPWGENFEIGSGGKRFDGKKSGFRTGSNSTWVSGLPMNEKPKGSRSVDSRVNTSVTVGSGSSPADPKIA